MRKRDHCTVGSCNIQKACDEWLTTRNKSKIRPRVVPHKKHPSALRHQQNFTASTLMLTQSPPPTQLKTCTKQSSILSFFQSSGKTNATDDKGRYEPGPHSGIGRDELSVSDCEDCSLACTGDQGLPSLSTGEQNLHRSVVFTDAIVHPEPGIEDDIDIPDPKKRRLHMERASSKMYYCQEAMEFIASNSISKGNKYYIGIGGPNNESKSYYTVIDGPNNESQSVDIDINGPNNESQCAEIDSNGPDSNLQSANIDSSGPNNDSQSADIDSNEPSNDSQNTDIDSNGPNNDSLSFDIDSNGPNNDSLSFDIDSVNFVQPMLSKSHYAQPKKERLQKNVNMDRTVSHSMNTLNNFCDDNPGYFVHSLEGSYSSSEIISNSVDTINNKQLELTGSVDSNIHNTQANSHSMMEGKCSGSKKQNSLQSDSLSLNWSQSDKVQKGNLFKESENSSDSISNTLPRFTSQQDGQNSPRIYTGDEFQFKSKDSLDKHDGIHLDSEFTLRFQREKYDRRERLSRLVALQPSGSYSSIEFSFENDSQY